MLWWGVWNWWGSRRWSAFSNPPITESDLQGISYLVSHMRREELF
jgi:hypothetical protein